MHLELAVPAMFRAPAAAPVAAPALELLLARARRAAGNPGTLEVWYRDHFALQGQPLPAGALTALAYGQAPGSETWLRADPVHLRADRDRLLLLPSAGFDVTAEEASALCAGLNQHFSEQFTLHAFSPERWGLRASTAMALHTRPPIELAGRNVDGELPDQRWHALLNEIQMALYQHPVNTAREARGAAVINSLWPWGSGPLPAATRGPWQSVSADDPVALGLARLAGMRHRPAGSGAAEWLERAPEDGRHLIVLDSLRGAAALQDGESLAAALRLLEERWFAPLLAALRAGRIGMITLQVPEAGTSFETLRGDLRRFWRRPQPLAAYREAEA